MTWVHVNQIAGRICFTGQSGLDWFKLGSLYFEFVRFNASSEQVERRYEHKAGRTLCHSAAIFGEIPATLRLGENRNAAENDKPRRRMSECRTKRQKSVLYQLFFTKLSRTVAIIFFFMTQRAVRSQISHGSWLQFTISGATSSGGMPPRRLRFRDFPHAEWHWQ